MEPKQNGVLNGSCVTTKEKRNTLLDPRFECPICLNCLKEPFLTKCGHRFCKECILEWMKKKKRGCPVDENTLDERDLFPDNYTRREIMQQVVKCTFMNCDAVMPMLDLEKHVADSHENNVLANLHPQGKDNIAKEADTWDAPPKIPSSSQLMTELYERLVRLEQKTMELELQLTNAKRTINEMQIEKEQFLAHLPLRICNGYHVWNVVNFKQKLLIMSKDPSEMFYSDGFYTSYLGYKFCARLNISPNNPNYLSLLVHLMKSENDYCLEWPFKGRISFTLIHPSNPELSVCEMMCSKSGLRAFDRPLTPICPRAFGYTEFTLIEDILNKGYINEDGSINIKIGIICI